MSRCGWHWVVTRWWAERQLVGKWAETKQQQEGNRSAHAEPLLSSSASGTAGLVKLIFFFFLALSCSQYLYTIMVIP